MESPDMLGIVAAMLTAITAILGWKGWEALRGRNGRQTDNIRLCQSLEGLTKEIQGLREEIRELTGEVRAGNVSQQLLSQRMDDIWRAVQSTR